MKNVLIYLSLFLIACLLADEANAQQPHGGFDRRPRVYYQPQITWFPQGATLNVHNPRVYIYGGRRYVRFGIDAGFYQIPRVDTFNFYNGEYRRGK